MALSFLLAMGLLSQSVELDVMKPRSEPIEVMVVGTWHFANNNLDLHNVDSQDMRTAQRQIELQSVSSALQAFRPTKVMVERESSDLIDPRYHAFDPTWYMSETDEIVQLGYRIAHDAGLKTVGAIDETGGEDEPDYFPFGSVASFAASNGQQQFIEKMSAFGEKVVQDLSQLQSSRSVGEVLAFANDPDGASSSITPYYMMLSIGDATQQPGAELNAYWYMRNAKIFSKLMQQAKPGDRIIVVFGAGHAFWLRHFAQNTPGFSNVDPRPFLLNAD